MTRSLLIKPNPSAFSSGRFGQISKDQIPTPTAEHPNLQFALQLLVQVRGRDCPALQRAESRGPTFEKCPRNYGVSTKPKTFRVGFDQSPRRTLFVLWIGLLKHGQGKQAVAEIGIVMVLKPTFIE